MSNSVVVPFVKTSLLDMFNCISRWWGFYVVFLLISIGSTILELPEFVQNRDVFYPQFVLVISSIVVSGLATIRFMERYENINFTFSQYGFGAFTYTLYSVAYIVLTIFGFILLIIPFFIFGSFFILAPLIALRESEGNAFKKSFSYVKRRPSIGLMLFLLIIVPEVLGYLASFFQKNSIAFYSATGVLTFIESAIAFFITKMAVDFYYSVRESEVV